MIFRKPEPTPIEVEGQTFLVRPLTAGELAKLLHQSEEQKKVGTPYKADFDLVALSITDQDGKPIFANGDDVAAVSPQVVGQFLKACIAANGLGETAEKKG